jgi:hypothetical protein
MRIIFGLVGLVVVLVIVSSLTKKQMSAVSDIKVPLQGTAVPVAVDPNASVKAQSQQIQQQVKQSVENALQQARPVDEK